MHKYSDHGVLYIDVNFDKKHDVAADYNNERVPCYLILSGVTGYVENVDSDVYDSFMYFENDKIYFEKIIDMNNKKIVGILGDTDDSGAVNFKQMKAHNDFLKINLENKITKLETKMNTSIKKSYYQEIFETFLI